MDKPQLFNKFDRTPHPEPNGNDIGETNLKLLPNEMAREIYSYLPSVWRSNNYNNCMDQIKDIYNTFHHKETTPFPWRGRNEQYYAQFYKFILEQNRYKKKLVKRGWWNDEKWTVYSPSQNHIRKIQRLQISTEEKSKQIQKYLNIEQSQVSPTASATLFQFGQV